MPRYELVPLQFMSLARECQECSQLATHEATTYYVTRNQNGPSKKETKKTKSLCPKHGAKWAKKNKISVTGVGQ